MEIAFRKNAKGIIPWMIRKWTKSKYSHCELVFRNGLTFSADIECYKTRIKTVNHPDDEWDFIYIPINIKDEYSIYYWALTELNCNYDIIGILFTQIIPLSFQSKTAWFCSELCVAALQQIQLIKDIVSWQTDPGELYRILQERFPQ